MLTRHHTLRRFLPLLAIVLISLAPSALTATDDGWRRTARGWEHTSTWKQVLPHRNAPQLKVAPESEPLHPMQLTALQIAASLFALAIFCRGDLPPAHDFLPA